MNEPFVIKGEMGMEDLLHQEEMSRCGMICTACAQYDVRCNGCEATYGKTFFITYFDVPICPIYVCSIGKNLPHCGYCEKMPCKKFDEDNPLLTDEENKNLQQEIVARAKNAAKHEIKENNVDE